MSEIQHPQDLDIGGLPIFLVFGQYVSSHSLASALFHASKNFFFALEKQHVLYICNIMKEIKMK